jgi:hypothetical protein
LVERGEGLGFIDPVEAFLDMVLSNVIDRTQVSQPSSAAKKTAVRQEMKGASYAGVQRPKRRFRDAGDPCVNMLCHLFRQTPWIIRRAAGLLSQKIVVILNPSHPPEDLLLMS